MAVEDYDALIRKHAAGFGLPVAWIKAVMQQESSGRPDAYRAEPQINDASYGLMQLLYRTAKGLGYEGSPEGLYDPETNIFLGSKLLADLRSRYGDDLRRVYSAYNSGKPDLYLTNSQVASNVNRVIGYLAEFLKKEPFIVATGGGAVLLIAVLLYLWAKRAS